MASVQSQAKAVVPASAAKVRRGVLRERIRKALPAYLFILPGMVLFIVWTLYPLLHSFTMSFTEWNLIKPSRFIGLENYTRAFNDPIFWMALRNTLFYTVVTVPGQMVLGLAIALLLDGPLRARGFFRTVYYIPVVTSWVVVSLIFTYLYNGQAGLINWVLRDGLHIIDKNINWLGEPLTANLAIASLGIWKGIGWTMVIFLAGLQSVPTHLYEAAAIDGATGLEQVRSITLPMLARTTTLILVLQVLASLKVFDQIFLMTNGGPNFSTRPVIQYIYEQGFTTYRVGYASAMSYAFFLLILVVSLGQFALLNRRRGRADG